MSAQLIITIQPDSIRIIRCDGVVPEFSITVDQQAANPNLGLQYQGSSLEQFLRKMSEILSEVTGSSLVLSFEPSEPQPTIAALALRNIRLVAARMLARKHSLLDGASREEVQHILRFCKEGGSEPSPLRGET